MPATALEFPTDVSVDQAARSCMEDADGDIQAAASLLRARADENSALAAKLTASLLNEACRDACRSVRTAARNARWLPGLDADADTTTESNERARRAASARLATLYDWPLSSGVMLGDATRDDVKAEAEMYANQARHNAERAVYMKMIAAKLRGAKTVREALSVRQLKNFQEKAAAE